MKVYGLRIGDLGIEFSSQESREKALVIFTRGSAVAIRDYAGPRYSDSKGAFSTYERLTEDQTANCNDCNGQFASNVCTARSLPARNYDKSFKSGNKKEEVYLCDGCYAKVMRAYDVWKAKEVLENEAS